MPILNYTTEVEAGKTVAEIERILVKHGARSILTNYDEHGIITSLSFKVGTPWGEMPIRLPVDPDAVLKVLGRQQSPRRYRTREQAVRIAWRIVKNWVEAQMAILETEMVRMDQIFLPYTMARDNKTLYEVFVETKGLLGEGKKTEEGDNANRCSHRES